MLDYPELIEEFDIRDEYELHNLLKKTEKKWNTDAKQQISPPKNAFDFFWTCQ